MKKIYLLTLSCLMTMMTWAYEGQGIIYVAEGGTGDGTSWESPMGDLNQALRLACDSAVPSNLLPDVWVKTGTYLVDTNLVVRDSVNVYGSFAGTETSIDERAHTSNKPWEWDYPSIIDGQKKTSLMIGKSSNESTNHTTVEGFIFQNGYTEENEPGGVYMKHNYIFKNNVIRNCETMAGGGGGLGVYPNAEIAGCLIENNKQHDNANGGGGINANTSSIGYETFIHDCVIRGNFSDVRGGGINAQGGTKVYIYNCRIYNNECTLADGTHKGGSLYTQNNQCVITNNLIYNNTGGLYTGPYALSNNTYVANAGNIYIASGTPNTQIVGNIIWNDWTDIDATTPTSLAGVAAEMKVWNNSHYNPLSEDKGWSLKGNVQFSSNLNNGDVKDPTFGCGSGPKFNKITSFVGAIPRELSKEDATIFLEELEQEDLFILTPASPCVNTGTVVIDTVQIITTTMVGGRPKRDTTYVYTQFVKDDMDGILRPQGPEFDMGCFELPYYSMGFNYNTEKVMVMTDMGELLTTDTTLVMMGGQQVVLYIVNMTEDLLKITQVASTDGGQTFTGKETDITGNLSDDGQITIMVDNYCQLKVELVPLQGLHDVASGVKTMKRIVNGQLIIVRGNKQYNALGAEL